MRGGTNGEMAPLVKYLLCTQGGGTRVIPALGGRDGRIPGAL